MTADRIPAQAGATSRCASCGTTIATSRALVTGVWTRSDGERVWYCEACTLDRLADIEAGAPARRR